jgi:VWFA-related protein
VYLLRREHITAASALLAGLGADDRVAIASYSDQPQLLLNFTADKREAAASLASAGYELGMSNLNFYASMASALDWLAAVDGKRAIVALTTGLDSSGPGPWQQLVARMRQSNVMVLPVALGGELRDSKTRAKKPSDASAPIGEEMSFEESNRALEAIAEETGGRAFFPRNARDFQEAYRRIALLLRHQYSLGFTAPLDDGRYHTIRVEFAGSGGKGYRINSRRGFLAPAQGEDQREAP